MTKYNHNMLFTASCPEYNQYYIMVKVLFYYKPV